MATVKISELEEVTELSSGDVLPIINANETKKVSIEKLNEILGGNADIGIQVMDIPGSLFSGSNTGEPNGYNTDPTTCELLSTYINECKGGRLKPLILKYGSQLELVGLFSPIIGSSTVGTSTNRYFLNSELRNTKNNDIVVSTGVTVYKYDRISFFIKGTWSSGVYTCTGYCVHHAVVNEITSGYVINNTLTRTNTQEYTPTEDYHPATKKYVDEIASGGASVDLTNYYTKDETDILLDEDKPGFKIYTARDVYSATNSSPLWVSSTSTGGQNIINAMQKAFDNGDYTFILRMYATSPSVVPYYIDIALTLPESGSGSITETTLYTVVRRTANEHMISECYASNRLSMSNGTVGANNTTAMALMFSSTVTIITTNNVSNYLTNYATKTYVDDAITNAITTVLEAEY